MGANSQNIAEPLCFYFPFKEPGVPTHQPIRNPQTITKVMISTPTDIEGVLEIVSQADRLSMQSTSEHLMEITLDHHALGHTKDYRPVIPLLLHW